MRRGRSRCGEFMFAAKRSSGKLSTEMFDDVSVLQRKWQAALRPGEGLPRYEDVMLGSLGRLADHIVLLKTTMERSKCRAPAATSSNG
jgi:hypothetical protein